MPQFKDVCREGQASDTSSKKLILGNPDSGVGIVTLWTKGQTVAEKIDPIKYNVLGQLFSGERGMDLLVRNLLANPHITNLVITGEDFSKSGIVLKDFFEKGFCKGVTEITEKPCWRVNSEYNGYIGIDIPKHALQDLRDSVNVMFIENTEGFDPPKLEKPPKTRTLKTFPRRHEPVKQYTGENIGYLIRHEKVAGAWLQILDNILKFGKPCGTHFGTDQKEILNLVSVITNEDPNSLHIPEFLPCNKQSVEDYIPRITTDCRREGKLYTYGSRMRSWFGVDQVREAIAKLAREKISRAVVIDLWDSEKDLTIGGSPCVNHIWLRIRDSKLYMTVTIRSNDMFEGYPENAFGLRTLQEVIRKELAQKLKEDIKLGDLVINSQSAHIYNDCWEFAKDIVKKYLSQYLPAPSEQYDPRGNFVITISNGEIIVEHTTPSGEPLGKYKGKTAKELRDILSRKNIIGNPAHATYLGMELQKAETALKKGIDYEQDKPLNLDST